MTITEHLLFDVVEHADGLVPIYQVDVDAEAEIVGCRRSNAGVGIAVLADGPDQPSGETKAVTFVLTPTVTAARLPGWIPTGLGTVDGQTVAQVEPDPDWHTPTH